jgi:hypothetical protein
MGFGFQTIAETKAVPFWQALVNSKQLTTPEFGIWLNRFTNDPTANVEEQNGGALTLGGTNSSLFTGDIEFLNMPSGSTPSFWLLAISGTHAPRAMCAVGANGLPIKPSMLPVSRCSWGPGATQPLLSIPVRP